MGSSVDEGTYLYLDQTKETRNGKWQIVIKRFNTLEQMSVGVARWVDVASKNHVARSSVPHAHFRALGRFVSIPEAFSDC